VPQELQRGFFTRHFVPASRVQSDAVPSGNMSASAEHTMYGKRMMIAGCSGLSWL